MKDHEIAKLVNELCDIAQTLTLLAEIVESYEKQRYPFPAPKSKSQLKRFLGMAPARMKKWLAKHGDIPACPGCGVMAGPHLPGCPVILGRDEH